MVVGAATVMSGVWACAEDDSDARDVKPQGTALTSVNTLPPDSTRAPSSDLVRPEGFERVSATITAADGTVCEVCLWLAETGDQRSRGLMGVTDVGTSDGTAEGMAFVYPRPHTGTFWMKNTLLPLSIAFFAESGEYLSSFDMEPCTAEPCPTYPTAPDFTVAIEVPQGDLPSLAIAEGSILDLSDLPCTET